MPIEVRELVVKVNVSEGAAPVAAFTPEQLAAWKRELVRECLAELRVRTGQKGER